MAATAVRKAYKKATLCVHPDKLQQRGATIQQKYICEKVFDLLKVRLNYVILFALLSNIISYYTCLKRWDRLKLGKEAHYKNFESLPNATTQVLC